MSFIINPYAFGGLKEIAFLLSELASIRGSSGVKTGGNYFANAFYNSGGIDTTLSQNESYNSGAQRWDATQATSTAFTEPKNNSNSGYYSGVTVRAYIAGTYVSQSSAKSRILLTGAIGAGPGTGCQMTIGAASGTDGSISGTVYPITVGGNATFTIPSTDDFYSDVCDCPITAGQPLVVCTYVDAGEVDYISGSTQLPQAVVKAGNDVATAAAVGYSGAIANVKNWGWREIQAVAINNLDLITDAYTAPNTPTKANIVVVYQPIDTPTLNTDLIARVSNNNGSGYTNIPLTAGGAATGYGFPAGSLYAYGEVTIAHGSPSNQIRLRDLIQNNKNVPALGIAGSYA